MIYDCICLEMRFETFSYSPYIYVLILQSKRRFDETPDRNTAAPSFVAGRPGIAGLQPSPSAHLSSGMEFGDLSMPGQTNAFDMWNNHGSMSPAFYHAPHYLSSSIGTAAMPMAENDDTPDVSADQKISGMTPLVFSAMPHAGFHYPSNAMAIRNVVNADGHVQQIYQVVSSDSQGDNINVVAPAPLAPMIVHNGMLLSSGVPGMAIPLQKPKKWVRWSEQEDQHLRRAVKTLGENNFKMISERVFHGTRTEVQCKNRWKKVRLFRVMDLRLNFTFDLRNHFSYPIRPYCNDLGATTGPC